MKFVIKFLKFSFWLGFAGFILGTGALLALYFYLEPQLPSTENLKSVRFQVPLRVYAADKSLIAEFGEKRRIPLKYEEIPEQIIQAFLAAEDDRFFEHPGVDYQGILRAAVQLALTGERRQGGSTITMQVARNFYLSSEKTFLRKLNEILLAFRIEQNLTKQEILELYLNKIYMGHRAYGIGSAAQVYYGKRVEELDLAQLATIAGLPKAPSRFNPITNPERALQRRDYVLGRMLKLGFITDQMAASARQRPATAALHAAKIDAEAPYVAEMVRAEMVERYGEEAYTEGFSVYTTIDSRLQQVANLSLRKGLEAYDRRHGYRGPERRVTLPEPIEDESLDRLLADTRAVGGLTPGLVVAVNADAAEVYLGGGRRATLRLNDASWARAYIDENRRGPAPKGFDAFLAAGDLIRVQTVEKEDQLTWQLAQLPDVAGALVSLDPGDGRILALVGGYDFYESKFNRVTQAKRQPGSGFKAFIYSAALEAGYTPASLINDAPVVIDDPSLESAWRPENYSGKFFGPTRLRYALTKSRNLVSIRLLREMGIEHAINHAARFGFDPEALPHNLSLALGSGGVTPIQMAAGYAVLANGGYRVEPYFINRILDSEGNTLYTAAPQTVCEDCEVPATTGLQETAPESPQHPEAPGEPLPVAPRVISEQNHYIMNSMMRDVITAGTARRARSLGRSDLAGKTGTTNDQRDAWFNGFNSSIVAIAWVGFDSSAPLGRGEVGGKAALPVWIDYMEEALKGVEEKPLKMPPGIVTVRIDPKSGKRAAAGQADAIFEIFRSENAPSDIARGKDPDQAGATESGGASPRGTSELF